MPSISRRYSDRDVPPARRRAEWRFPDPSDYFLSLASFELSGCRVVLYCRVSRRQQQARGNLRDQEEDLRAVVRRADGTVIAVYSETASGCEPDRPQFEAAIDHAHREGAIVLADSTDRLVRPGDFHPARNPDGLLLREELEALRPSRVTIVTRHHPDMSWKQVRGMQARRGQQAKGSTGGRPRKCKRRQPGELAERRADKLDAVLQLHRDGYSYRQIENELKVPASTARRWVKKYG